MKLLIVTQKVNKNDPILGFFTEWIREFSKNYEKVTVICLEKGEYDLPENVKVLSLGKEETWCRIKWVYRFYKYIWQERKNYDNVFVHMNQIYVILGGVFWRAWGKKIGLWYAHGSVSTSLKFAERFTDYILTSTESGFRLDSQKKNVIGQGIDTDLFKPSNNKKDREILSILSVGRISATKNINLFIDIARVLKRKNINFVFKIIGDSVNRKDNKYFNEIKKEIDENNLNNQFEFLGSIPHNELIPYYQNSDIFINLSDTGSMDKVVLEAMSVGMQVVTSNEAFKDILDKEYFTSKDLEEISSKLIALANKEKDSKLRQYIEDNHGLKGLILKIVKEYE